MDLPDLGAHVTEHWRGIAEIGVTLAGGALAVAWVWYDDKSAEAREVRKHKLISVVQDIPPEHRRSIDVLLEAGAQSRGKAVAIQTVYGAIPPEHRPTADAVLRAVNEYGNARRGFGIARGWSREFGNIERLDEGLTKGYPQPRPS